MSSSERSPVLVIPQWQGYAADDRPRRGALAIAAALEEPLHTIAVPAWHALARDDAGDGHGVYGLHELVGQGASVLKWLEAEMPARQLVIGGDCGSDLAPIAWQSGRCGDELGVLYLDAHADLNTPASSPSGRFHGMVLRTALGEGAAVLTALGPRALTAAQLVMAGTRELDEPERAYLEAAELRPWPADAISDGRVLAAVMAHPARRWHVHFDLDVLDPDDFPDVTVPTPGGPRLEAVTRLLVELVAAREVASIAVTEHVGGAASAARIAALIAAVRSAGWV